MTEDKINQNRKKLHELAMLNVNFGKEFTIAIHGVETIDYLQQENEELKLQLKGTTHCYDEEEHRKLENNWNELKRWLYEDHYLYVPEIARNSTYQKVLDKMERIEKGEESGNN